MKEEAVGAEDGRVHWEMTQGRCELHGRAEAACCSVVKVQKPYVSKGRCSVG